jgi:hypothetical protein
MRFDRLAMLMERHAPETWQQTLRVAALMQLPNYNPNEMACDDLRTQFRMPWNAMVMEDDISVVVLQRRGKLFDSESEKLKSMRGGDVVHGVSTARINERVRCRTSDVGLETGDVIRLVVFFWRDEKSGAAPDIALCAEMAFCGTRELEGGTAKEGLLWSTSGVHVVSERGHQLVTGDDMERFQMSTKALIDNLHAGMNQCVMVTRPAYWIVKRIPGRQERRAIERESRSAGVPKSHQRHRWLLISDAERQRSFREHSEPTGRHVVPHARRGHFRHIGDNEDGSRRHTWVRACWVGSTEAEIRGGCYRVELDL